VPELPEVETIVRDLRPALVGRRCLAVKVGPRPLRRRWARGWTKALVGRRIREVRRRGKWIVLALDGGCHLIIHLGMTGQLRVLGRDEPVPGHTHLVVDLDPGRKQLRFRDVRRFGSASMIADRAGVESFFETVGLGPEPFDLDTKYWRERLAGTTRFLKAVLLDQRVLAGVGNIYADESLFEARLHPGRRGRELRPPEADRLRRALVKVLVRAIERHGSTIRDYVRGSGDEGAYQNEFRVYGRAGQPCGRCGTPIHRLRMAGRSTHFCPRCQVDRAP
jgi:formamidopyrimidine-DNA glycosylase